MKTLTVFTPTYNRAHILHNCYEALLRQTCKDFLWIIVDDGSNDSTKEIVDEWIKENKFEIQYIWQENQGMHGAHNTAHMNSITPLTVCCDSDDYLSDEAVETIVTLWKEKSDEKYAGIIGHDSNLKGEKLVSIPSHLSETSLYDLRYRYKLKGDFKLVYRTELLKNELYPIIKGESYLAVGYKYFLIEQKHKLIVSNKILCYIDYQNDGGTANKIRKYVEAPKGFMHYRLKMLPIMHSPFKRYWQAVHYVSSALFAREWNFLLKTPCKGTTFLAIPLGLGLNIYIRIKYLKKYKKGNRWRSKYDI